MAISDKLTYLNDTKTKIREAINGLGANLTSEDTFRSYVNALNDIYDYLPKVTGSGTSITLNNTIKGRMNIELGTSELSQETTTGKNLLEIALPTQTTARNGITFTNNGDGSFTLNGTATANADFRVEQSTPSGANNLKNYNGDYTVYCPNLPSGVNLGSLTYNNGTYGAFMGALSQDTPLINKTVDVTNAFFYIIVTSGVTLNNVTLKPMFVRGTYNTQTIGDFEPYTGGIPAPNPQYPQTIHTISGNNTIVVEGKNLANIKNSTIHLLINTNGTTTTNTNYNSIIIDTKNQSNVYVSGNFSMLNSGTLRYGIYSDYPDVGITGTRGNLQANGAINTTGNYLLLCFLNESGYSYDDIQSSFMISYGSTATTYTPYTSQEANINLGDIEYCEIGDYKDVFVRSDGINKFNKSTSTANKYLSSSDGSLLNSSSSSTSDFIDINENTQYTISGYGTSSYYKVVAYYNSEKAFISANSTTNSDNTYTITTPNNAKYLRFHYTTANENQVMLNNGTTVLPYQPYGIGNWGIRKAIGKVVLDGSEDWTADYVRFKTPIPNSINVVSRKICYSNYFHYLESGTEEGGCFVYLAQAYLYPTSDITTVADFKTWLSTHNTIVYYQLETPTYTQITGTLAEQLENIYQYLLSQKEQTNISQVNNDLPFVISASALLDLSEEE